MGLLQLSVQTLCISTLVYMLYCDFQIPHLYKGAFLGKGLYLTHQTQWILATYFLLGFVASVKREVLGGKPWVQMDRFVHWSSVLAGGFGLFLTIMFYALVWPNPTFHETVVKPWERKGIPITYYFHVIHAPSIVLVLLEAFVKQPQLTRSTVGSAASYFQYFAAFGAWYVFVLRYNHYKTNGYPYPFMDEFTAWWHHWVFYCFCFGFIWALACVYRSFLLVVQGTPTSKVVEKPQNRYSLRSKDK